MNIEEVFRKLRPILGQQLDLLWQEFLVADPGTRKAIEQTLRVTLAQRLSETFDSEHVLLKPPPPDLAAGEYPAGMIHYGKDSFYPFGLREDEFIQHIGIFGRSGSGKTNLAYLLLRDLIRAGKPFLVFDWKRNYRDLIAIPEFHDLFVFTVGRDIAPFRFNPLIPPPGTPATVWLKKLIEIMCHVYFLGEGVTVLLMRAIDHLYGQAGLYEDRAEVYPTMANVRDYLQAYRAKGREASWMESALRAVEVLCFGEMGRVLNEPPYVHVPRLLDRRVILELDALTNNDKTFLIESFLLWIHHYRLGQPQREQFKHAIIIEEAHHILLRKKQEVTGKEAVTDVLLREIRELGEAVIVLDQHPSLISKPALGNTYTTFAFNLKHRGDIAMIQDSLHLDGEQTGYLGRLEVGWTVVRLQGRWFFPFLVKLPLFRLGKGAVTDEEIQRRARSFLQGGDELFETRKGCSGVIPGDGGEARPMRAKDTVIPAVPPAGKQEEEKTKDRCTIQLTTQERAFLTDVHEHPTSTVTQRYRRLCLSARRGTILQSSLLSSSLLSTSSIIVPKGRVKVLTLTDEGRTALGIITRPSHRPGGTTHRYWVHRIAQHLRANGYSVAGEVPVGGGKTIDLVAGRSGKRIAFEIETGKSGAAANVRKCLAAGMDRVVVVATSRTANTKVAPVLPNDGRVVCVTPDDLLKPDQAAVGREWISRNSARAGNHRHRDK